MQTHSIPNVWKEHKFPTSTVVFIFSSQNSDILNKKQVAQNNETLTNYC